MSERHAERLDIALGGKFRNARKLGERGMASRLQREVALSRSCPPLLHHLAAAVAVVLAFGCRGSPSEPEASPTLSLTLSPTDVTVEQGKLAELTGTVTVGGSFTGSATVTLVGVPAGVGSTVGTPIATGKTTTVPVTISVGLSVPPGPYPITVRASGSGVSDEAALTLTVIAAPRYDLEVAPTAFTLEQGTSGTADVTVVRTNFTEDVTLTAEDTPSDMTVSFDPTVVSGDASVATVTVHASVPTDDYELTIRGTTPSLSDRTATVTVTVTDVEGFSLEPISDITIQQGGSDSRAVTITRTGAFEGEVTFSITPTVAGLAMALDPTSTADDGVTLTATASASLAPGTYSFELTGTAAGEPATSTSVDVNVTPMPSETTTVRPATIDDVLYNPGMGFTDSHFAYGYQYPEDTFISFGDYLNPPPYPDPGDYPPSTVAYFRWCWSAVEPTEGQIDFERFDAVIAHAAERSEGERFGFRILTVYKAGCMPDWLTSKPGYVGYDVGQHVPDYSNPVFLEALERLFSALGNRYDGRLDHLDLGIIGCWGEWNTACLNTDQDLCEIMDQSDSVCLETLERIIDIQMDAFPNTPRIMLGKGEGVKGDAMDYALNRGAGWRVDCFGDWGVFADNWNHQTDVYPQVVSRVGDAWKRGPVHMEVCITLPYMYYGLDMSVELVRETFDWALDNHISVFNGKSTPVPPLYWPVVEDFLKKAGYRLVIDSATHPSRAGPGQPVLIETHWKNLGVAPPYLPHEVAFRLRDAADHVVVQKQSDADILGWLPGDHSEADTIELPADLEPGTYSLDAAILTPDGAEPAIDLAIEGRRADGWYQLSVIDVE